MGVGVESGKLGFTKTVNLTYAQAVERTRQALKEQGFGVLTEIDVQKTLKEKLGVDYQKCLILGACNPALAHQVLAIEPEVSLLLPCNVVVGEKEGRMQVSVINAEQMVGFVGNPKLAPIAEEVNRKLSAALSAI